MQLFDIIRLETLRQSSNSFIKSVLLTCRYHLKNITGSLVKMDLQLVQLMLVMRVGIVFSDILHIDKSSILILNRNYRTTTKWPEHWEPKRT